jgi:hypothetical protein
VFDRGLEHGLALFDRDRLPVDRQRDGFHIPSIIPCSASS